MSKDRYTLAAKRLIKESKTRQAHRIADRLDAMMLDGPVEPPAINHTGSVEASLQLAHWMRLPHVMMRIINNRDGAY